MPDYRNIHTELWTDDWVLGLEPEEKLLWIYLFSNSRSVLAGLYDIGLRLMAWETGLPEDIILAYLQRFAEEGKAYYENGVMWVPNMPVRNAYNIKSPKIYRNIVETLTQFRRCRLRQAAIEYWNQVIAPRYDVDVVVVDGADDLPGVHRDEAVPAPEVPTTFADWQELVRNPPKSSNRTAVLVRMAAHLYPGYAPNFGLMGKAAEEAGGAGRMADLLWQYSTRPPTGDPVRFILGAVKKGRAKHGTGRDGSSASDSGWVNPHGSDLPEEQFSLEELQELHEQGRLRPADYERLEAKGIQLQAVP